MNWEKELYNEDERPLDRLVDGYSNTAIFRTMAFVGDSLSSGEFETLDPDGNRGYYDYTEAPYYDLKVFYDIDKELQSERITARCGEEGATDFFVKWIPLEEIYIEEFKIIESCDKIINAKP